MEMKTLCFKAPIEIHQRIERVIKGDITVNKQSFIYKAVLEALKKAEK
jgi:hypothetical protein